jgi:hypothetical protein
VSVEAARVGHDPELCAGEQSGLPASAGFRPVEGGAVRGDPQNGDYLRLDSRDGPEQVPGAGAEFCRAQLGGLSGCPGDQGGDADPAAGKVLAVAGRESGGGVDEPVSDACFEQGRVKAVAAPREGRLYRYCRQAGVDADEQQPRVRPEQVR